MEGDPTSFEEAMRSVYSFKWQEAMKVKMNSMNTNDVQDLEEIPNGVKRVRCNWVYKTKYDFKRNIERYKARLVAIYLRKENEQITMRVFSLILCKDSFRIIMTLLRHYDLELHQMDVKTTFLNGDLYENKV